MFRNIFVRISSGKQKLHKVQLAFERVPDASVFEQLDIVKTEKTEFWETDIANATGYYNQLCGKINYVLQIEAENKWFADALVLLKEKYESIYT